MRLEENRTLNVGDFNLYFVGKRRINPEALISWDQYIFRFENNYGASVVQYKISESNIRFVNTLPTHMQGFEIAVIKFDDDNLFDLVYDTPITDDVITGLDNEEVLDVLRKIKEL